MSDKNGQANEEIRVGVYTCKCGGNIGDVVRCEAVAKSARQAKRMSLSRAPTCPCVPMPGRP